MTSAIKCIVIQRGDARFHRNEAIDYNSSSCLPNYNTLVAATANHFPVKNPATLCATIKQCAAHAGLAPWIYQLHIQLAMYGSASFSVPSKCFSELIFEQVGQ